ncbi:hypothetical protein NPIL_171261 [Nephila pilipes]|uniref:Uncharacterized protein n=1 Tax=Nephila pilipes TaxID=299642 RepID=A0A8X6U7W8_NEPPI|nr:hypothetical protein NPIL_171261 [Nephila pilipes]
MLKDFTNPPKILGWNRRRDAEIMASGSVKLQTSFGEACFNWMVVIKQCLRYTLPPQPRPERCLDPWCNLQQIFSVRSPCPARPHTIRLSLLHELNQLVAGNGNKRQLRSPVQSNPVQQAFLQAWIPAGVAPYKGALLEVSQGMLP